MWSPVLDKPNAETEEPLTERLTVPLTDGRDYPVILGAGGLEDPANFDPYIGSQAMVVTNPTVAGHCLDRLRQGLANVPQLDIFEIGDGERFKTVDTWSAVLDRLIERRHNRTTTLIALGGGVVGDVAGFAAASYQRGVGPRSGADHAARPSRFLRRRQDRGESPRRQEPDRRLLSAPSRGGGHGRAANAAGARVPRRTRGSHQIRCDRRRRASSPG